MFKKNHTKKLQEKINVIYRDYREHQGEYSRIYSIEMFEAVGMQYWQAYFDKVKDLLKPSGSFFNADNSYF